MRFSIIQPILTSAAVVCSLSAVIQPVSVSAEDSGLQLSECYVYDEAGVLTSEEAIELDELVYETAVDPPMNIVSDWVRINSPVKVMQENMPLPTT